MTDHGSCYSCRWLEDIEGDYGYCKYPVPVWIHLLVDNRMPIRYAPCPTYEYDPNKDES